MTAFSTRAKAPFVGRERELSQLVQLFQSAAEDTGSLAMVIGEPGIGKTFLCEQLAALIESMGGRALFGHSYEEGSLSLPYLPFVEALRSFVVKRDPADLVRELGSTSPELSRIVPELRGKLGVSPPRGLDPEAQHWQLLNAVSDALRGIAESGALLLVLEDLHWADRGTLDLLLHLARNLQGARILVVCTYRDVEVDRAHPL